LFVNIHPQDLNEDDFLELEPHLKPWAARLVLEVTETEAIRDATRARMQIRHLARERLARGQTRCRRRASTCRP